MKNVLVLLHDDDGQEARLQVALDVTRALSGHMVGCDVVVPPAVVSDFSGTADAMVLAYAAEHEGQNRTHLAQRLENEDVSWSMIDAIGSPGEELTAAADLADLIVVTSRPGEHTPLDAKHTVAQVTVKAHRPVLAVPPECKGLDVEGKALVAWNGSHQANEALRAAVPLLQQAKSVTLLEVNNPRGDMSIDEAAAYLSRHGIHAKVIEATTEGPVCDKIVEKARDIGAAYVVLGAYGPGRAIEAVFGGVTVGVLRQSDVPVLLAH